MELKGSDNEDSLRGAGLGTRHHVGGIALLVDEFASIYDNWSVWHEVLRPMLSDHKSGALFISTPKGKDAFWELWMKGQRNEDGWKSWQFNTNDNPYIDPAEIEEARRTMPERYFKQEYEGSFEDFVGLIWPEFDEKIHTTPFINIKDHYRKIGVIDTALSGTTAVLWAAIDDDNNVLIYDEYYERDKRVSEVVAEINKRDEVTEWIIDPASRAQKVQRMGKLYSLYDEYDEYGINPVDGENDVDAGINRVGEYFKQNKISIRNNCKNLMWEIDRYHWAEERETIAGVMRPRPFKDKDHLCDCLRYLAMSRPSSGEKLQQTAKRGSVAHEMLKQEQESSDWRSRF